MMNEKIKQFAQQARQEFLELPTGYTAEQVRMYPQLMERFAELIVRECMAMCKTAVGNADYNTGRLHCLNNIKEHFGIKE